MNASNHASRLSQPPLITDDHYLGIPLNVGKAPFHRYRLESSLNTIFSALEDYGKVMMVTCLLRTIQPPQMPSDQYSNGPIERFLRHLKSMLNASQNRLSATINFKHRASLDYIWSSYTDDKGIPCYSVMLFLNKEGVFGHSQFGTDQETLQWRIRQAWTTAINIAKHMGHQSVQFSPTGFQIISNAPDDISNAFRIASLRCRASENDYGQGSTPFGCSRPSPNATHRD